MFVCVWCCTLEIAKKLQTLSIRFQIFHYGQIAVRAFGKSWNWIGQGFLTNNLKFTEANNNDLKQGRSQVSDISIPLN